MLKEIGRAGLSRGAYRRRDRRARRRDPERSPATRSTPSRWSSTGWCAGGIERRLTDRLETALRLAEGVAEVEIVPPAGDSLLENESEARCSRSREHLACTHCGISFDELAPRNFSFNSPYGACPTCDGLGTRSEVDPELVVPDEDLTIDAGRDRAMDRCIAAEYFGRVLAAVAEDAGFSLDHAVAKLTKAADKKIVLLRQRRQDVPRPLQEPLRRSTPATRPRYEGVIPWLERRHTEAESDTQREQIEGYMREVPCPDVRGRAAQAASHWRSRSAGSESTRSATKSIRESAEAFASSN